LKSETLRTLDQNLTESKHVLRRNTVKLSKFKRLPKRIKYEFVTANRTRTFLLFLCFFFKKFGSVRSKRTSKLTEYDAFKS